MAILSSLQRLLDGHNVPHQVHTHRTAMTAAELAAADHVPPSEVAKVVVLRSAERFLLAALPATRQLDVERLGALVGDPQLRLATEAEFADAFPECELGAIPPIGELVGGPLGGDDSPGREAAPGVSPGPHRR